MAAALGLMGGTFDPIHIGHLRGAIECRERLGLEAVVLIPAAIPPLKATPGVSAEHRARMVELAVEGDPRLRVDCREVDREGLSYTVDTLASFRAELGGDASLSFVIGADSLERICAWHQWRRLVELANIVVIERPGWEHPSDGVVSEWLHEHHCEPAAIAKRPAGGIVCLTQPVFQVASTDIRARLNHNKSVRFLLPEPVIEYIASNDLYRD